MRQSLLLLIITVFAFSSCRLYRRDVFFKAPKEKEAEFAAIGKMIKTPKNYLVQKNDQLEFRIFTNKGESLIDPTSEYIKQVSTVGSGVATGSIKYLIQADGCADLPIIGHTKLDSLTLHQVDSLLSEKYGKYYQDVFVVSKISAQYIYFLGNGSGSLGGMSGGSSSAGSATAFELKRENITLFEFLSQVRGLGIYSHAERIKIIRGDLKNPIIFTVDVTGWDTFQQSNLVLQPNDIVYVEPARRKAFEFLRDYSIISGIISTFLTLYIITRL